MAYGSLTTAIPLETFYLSFFLIFIYLFILFIYLVALGRSRGRRAP